MKGMTDMYSRVMKNRKADIKRLHPNALFTIRFMNAILYNSHLLFRAFAIEDQLGTMLLHQLRHALKDLDSFDALMAIARSYSVLHSGCTGALSAPPQQQRSSSA